MSKRTELVLDYIIGTVLVALVLGAVSFITWSATTQVTTILFEKGNPISFERILLIQLFIFSVFQVVRAKRTFDFQKKFLS